MGMLFLSCAPPANAITLTPDNTVVLRGEVTNQSVAAITKSLFSAKSDHVYLFIDSPGGSIFAGLRLINALSVSPKHITCIANTAISMAFAIFQTCNERLIVDKALLMQHVAAYSLEGQEPNNYSFSQFLHRMMIDLDSKQAKRLGMTTQAFREKTRDDWWMWGNEALTNKAADRMVQIECSKEMFTQFDIQTLQVMFFSIDLKFYKCPMIATPIEEKVPENAKKTPGFDQELTRMKEQFNSRSLTEKRFNSK
jgi:ATP-dependent protease ClpP protease subunit